MRRLLPIALVLVAVPSLALAAQRDEINAMKTMILDFANRGDAQGATALPHVPASGRQRHPNANDPPAATGTVFRVPARVVMASQAFVSGAPGVQVPVNGMPTTEATEVMQSVLEELYARVDVSRAAGISSVDFLRVLDTHYTSFTPAQRAAFRALLTHVYHPNRHGILTTPGTATVIGPHEPGTVPPVWRVSTNHQEPLMAFQMPRRGPVTGREGVRARMLGAMDALVRIAPALRYADGRPGRSLKALVGYFGAPAYQVNFANVMTSLRPSPALTRALVDLAPTIALLPPTERNLRPLADAVVGKLAEANTPEALEALQRLASAVPKVGDRATQHVAALAAAKLQTPGTSYTGPARVRERWSSPSGSRIPPRDPYRVSRPRGPARAR